MSAPVEPPAYNNVVQYERVPASEVVHAAEKRRPSFPNAFRKDPAKKACVHNSIHSSGADSREENAENARIMALAMGGGKLAADPGYTTPPTTNVTDSASSRGLGSLGGLWGI